MAKFATEATATIVIEAPISQVYAYLWDVAGSAACIPGIASCRPTEADTYHFRYEERSVGPVSMVVCYTARYHGNGVDRIDFRSIAAEGDNTDVDGTITLAPLGDDATEITLRQMTAPDSPVPRLVQGLVRGFVEGETAQAVADYLANVRTRLERA
jgi:carbon monoxide dehydrogenase subunit G